MLLQDESEDTLRRRHCQVMPDRTEYPRRQENLKMIARVWHGYTKPEHAEADEPMLNPKLLPGSGAYKMKREVASPRGVEPLLQP